MTERRRRQGLPSGTSRPGQADEEIIDLTALPVARSDFSDSSVTVLVVGAGFIGSHICRRLLAAGFRVRTLTRSEPEPKHARLLEGTEIVVAEATDAVAVDAAMRDVSWTICGAGGLVPAASQADPIDDVNLALHPLLTVLTSAGVHQSGFTYLSSGGTVYGNTSCDSISEAHPTEPITAYGVLKLAGEKFTNLYGHQSGIPVRVLRCANVYGDGQRTKRGQGAVGAFLNSVWNGTGIPFYGDGGVVRDYVHIQDVAEAVLRLRPQAGTQHDPAVVNVGSGVGTSLAELLSSVERTLGRPASLRRLAARAFDVQRNVLDISLLRGLTGIEPMSLDAGLRLTASDFLSDRLVPATP